MQQFRAATMRAAVFIVLYAITAQAMLASAICPSGQSGVPTVTCTQGGSGGDHLPAHDDGACCALSCCLMGGAVRTPPSPDMILATWGMPARVAWTGLEFSPACSRIIAHAHATGPPPILNRIAI
jgi:hypothetical protein